MLQSSSIAKLHTTRLTPRTHKLNLLWQGMLQDVANIVATSDDIL